MACPTASNTEEISELTQCGICWEPYTKGKKAPITLQCGHTFCRDCLVGIKQAIGSIRCGICGARMYMSTERLEKNFQFIEFLTKIGVLKEDPISAPCENPVGENLPANEEQQQPPILDENNVIEAPNAEPNQAQERRPEIMAEIEIIGDVLQHINEDASKAIARLREIAQDFQGNVTGFHIIVSRIHRRIRELVYHPLASHLYRRIVQYHDNFIIPVLRVPQPDIPEDLMEDLNLQAVLMEQIRLNARVDENAQNNVEPEREPENERDALRQNITAFVMELRDRLRNVVAIVRQVESNNNLHTIGSISTDSDSDEEDAPGLRTAVEGGPENDAPDEANNA